MSVSSLCTRNHSTQSDDMDVLDSDDTEMVQHALANPRSLVVYAPCPTTANPFCIVVQVYSEFLEALIAVSCWMIPDPYLTMGMRVRKFIEINLLPKSKNN